MGGGNCTYSWISRERRRWDALGIRRLVAGWGLCTKIDK
jgi:hypothetical protein